MSSLTICATYPPNFFLLHFYHPSNIWSDLPKKKPFIIQFFILPLLSFLGPNNFLSALFLIAPSLCSSLNFKDKILNRYKARIYVTL